MRTSARLAMIPVAAIVALVPVPAFACSKGFFVSTRSERLAFLIGRATADTLHAGAGRVQYRVSSGHSGPAGDRSIFGQLVSVERHTGVDEAQLPASSPRVLLVPWDYGADCRPTPLMRSARWLPIGTRGLFHGTLRPREQWVNGVPTLDVFTPAEQPYPGGAGGVANRRALGDSILSIDELFPLLHLLPTESALRDSVERAVEPLLTWARANPTLARRAPMEGAVRWASYVVREARTRRITSPVPGTYRFVVSIPGDSDRVFFARTEAHPTSDWTDPSTVVVEPTAMRPISGYYLLTHATPSLAALPRGCYDRADAGEAYFGLLVDPPVGGPDGLEWRGEIDLYLLARTFPRDSTLASYARSWGDQSTRRYIAKLPHETPARFTMQAGQPMQVRMDLNLDNGRRMELRGERVSLEVSRCR